MKLYLVRHAEAVDVGERGITTDAGRTLTAKGIEQSRRAGEFMKKHAVMPEIVISSPLTRAIQTARQLAGILAPDLEVRVVPQLAPGTPLENTIRTLGELKRTSIIAVGHMPEVAELASALLTGSGAPFLSFGKASIAALDFETCITIGEGTLEWFVRSRLLK